MLPGKAQMHRAWEKLRHFIKEGIKNKKSVRQMAFKMTGIEVNVTTAFQTESNVTKSS